MAICNIDIWPFVKLIFRPFAKLMFKVFIVYSRVGARAALPSFEGHLTLGKTGDWSGNLMAMEVVELVTKDTKMVGL